MKKIFLVVVCFLNFNFLFGEMKIGWVDTNSIFAESEELIKAYNDLDVKRSEIERELMKKKTSLDSLYNDYQTKEMLLSPESLNTLKETIIALEQELQFGIQNLDSPNGELAQYFDQLVLPIQNRLLEAIEKIAISQGYDYVLDCSVSCLYRKEAHDLTGIVKDELKKMAIDTIEE